MLVCVMMVMHLQLQQSLTPVRAYQLEDCLVNPLTDMITAINSPCAMGVLHAQILLVERLFSL